MHNGSPARRPALRDPRGGRGSLPTVSGRGAAPCAQSAVLDPEPNIRRVTEETPPAGSTAHPARLSLRPDITILPGQSNRQEREGGEAGHPYLHLRRLEQAASVLLASERARAGAPRW
ncbi:hypothetical protein NDU88_006284 [Pleurodeles waltl]|uniref:Uncharacterized protein n=1 Tax=Pleurodeles waltl TaxID=8319 RepID=A0AAV7MCG8_PLEWA|nr:hypothetical protein NDU88_006284 [Pleurodeles waltl]